jgi:hypothetical protein
MAYIYCDICGIGFHSNVHSCPECGRMASRAYDADHRRRRVRRGRRRSPSPREEVESEVRESIYGWRSGTVERCDGSTRPAGAVSGY